MTTKAAYLAGVAPRAMFSAPATTNLMLRGPQVTYAPENDAGAAADLSVDQAIDSLTAPPEENDPAAPVEAAAGEETEADPDPAEDASEAEEPGDGEEPEEKTEAAAEPVPAPQWWDAEAKAHFATLTPEAQAIVFAQEEKREAITAKVKQEAAEARQAAQADIASVQQLAEKLGEFLPRAVETFQQQWGEPDWAAVAREHGADQAFILKTQFEDQQRQLQQVAEAKQQADERVRVETLRAENEKLKGTPLEPVAARQEVGKYLTENGYDRSELANASARDLLLAHKAMLYDKAQAALKAKKPHKPATQAPARAPVRPAASQPGSPQSRTVAQVQHRFAQTKSVDDAVALLLSKG